MKVNTLHRGMFSQECSNILKDHAFNSASCLVVQIDSQGRIVAANTAFMNRAAGFYPIEDEPFTHYFNTVAGDADIPVLWGEGERRVSVFEATVADDVYIIHAYPMRDHALLIGERGGDKNKDSATIELMGKITLDMSDVVRKLRKSNHQLASARQAAEQANQAKSAFLAAMSHEIRTPMNGVVGLVDVLRRSPLNAEQQAMLATIKDSAFSLLSIIDEILDFSKIEANKLTLEHTAVSLRQLVEGVGDTLQPLAARKQVQLHYYYDSELPEWVLADSVRLRQILFNLTGNAVKFTGSEPPHSGWVSLQANCRQETPQRCRVHFQVSDNGIGIDPEKLPHLFQPFSQAESSTTRRFGGTGLGLSICARLVEMMGGTITVTSQLGKGSTFAFELEFERALPPASDQDAVCLQDDLTPAVTAPSLEEARAAGQLILVAEDNATNRTVIRYQLKALGYVAEITDDGLQALERLRTGRYALLLTDYHMPHLDGLALTTAVRQRERYHTQRLPIIVLTANAIQEEAERFLAAGADAVLTKPVVLEDMRRLLSRWIPAKHP